MHNIMGQLFSVREFRCEDAVEIVRLHKESEQFFEEMDIDEEFILNLARRADFRFFVASIDCRIAGFCGVLFFPNVGRAEIGPIAVDVRCRNRDVATQLFAETTRFLKENGVRRLIARVKADNSNAESFFLRMGFEKEGFFRQYTKKGEDVTQYVKFME